jgi:hypothetical protein
MAELCMSHSERFSHVRSECNAVLEFEAVVAHSEHLPFRSSKRLLSSLACVFAQAEKGLGPMK